MEPPRRVSPRALELFSPTPGICSSRDFARTESSAGRADAGYSGSWKSGARFSMLALMASI